MNKWLISLLLVMKAVQAQSAVINNIQIEGTKQKQEIIKALKLKVGQKITDEDLARIVKQLFLQNKFDNIQAVLEGKTLKISVKEIALIHSLTFEGNKIIPTDFLLQTLKTHFFAKGEVFDAIKFDQFKQALLDNYKSLGYYSTTLKDSIQKNSDGSVDITLKVNENNVTKVKSINFIGNKQVSSKTLISLLEIKPGVPWWNFFSTSKLRQDLYQKNIDAIRNYYLNNGFAKFELLKSDTNFDKDNLAEITYTLNEGKIYNISSLELAGDSADLGINIKNFLNKIPKGKYNNELIEEIKKQIKNLLGNSGFYNATVDIVPIFNETNNTVRIIFAVNAGERVFVNKIIFKGNLDTGDKTIRNALRQQEGTVISTTALELGKIRLERTGFYETVEMKVVPTEKPNYVDVIYTVKERNTGSINFGVGYGSKAGFNFQAGIKKDNFLGMGSSLGLSANIDKTSNSLSVNYNEPYFTTNGVSLGANLYFDNLNTGKKSKSTDYKKQTFGFGSNIGIPVTENNSVYLGASFNYDKLNNVQREYYRELYVKSLGLSDVIKDNYYSRIKTTDFILYAGWNYNTLNRGFFPTDGTYVGLDGKLVSLFSSNRYYKLSFDFKHFHPLDDANKWVVSSSFNTAFANGLQGRLVPFFELFSAGGIGSLRGFGSGSIGQNAIFLNNNGCKKDVCLSYDVIGGNVIAKATISLIFPTPFISEKYQNSVRTSFFIDSATVWNSNWQKTNKELGHNFSQFDFDKKKIRASVGVYLEWQSPFGPLALSFAQPIKKEKYDDIERFQINLGGSF